jgi:hypothetical protein
MEIKNEQLAMCVRIDGKQGRIFINPDGTMISPRKDENGFPLYIASKEFIKQLCASRPDRYKLYKSAPINVQTRGLRGENAFKTIYPFVCREETYQTGVDPENDEAIYGKRYVWEEDTGARSAIPENKIAELYTSKTTTTENTFNQRIAQELSDQQRANGRLLRENTELKEKVVEFEKKLEAVMKEIAEGKSSQKQPEAVEPKQKDTKAK